MLLDDSLNNEDRHAKTGQHVRKENQIRAGIGVRTIGWRCAVHEALWNGVTRRAETRRRHQVVDFGELLLWAITYLVRRGSFYGLVYNEKTCSVRAKGSIRSVGNVY
jgi:hypothetical protein